MGIRVINSSADVFLPIQTNNAGKYLSTDGSTASWNSLPQKLSILNRSANTVIVPFIAGYLAVLNRSSTTINVSIT